MNASQLDLSACTSSCTVSTRWGAEADAHGVDDTDDDDDSEIEVFL